MATLPPRTRSGNIGISRRRGQQQNYVQSRIAMYVIGIVVLYLGATTLYISHFAGFFVPDVEVDENGRTRVRRRPHRHKKKLDPNAKTTEYDAVLEGYLTLVDISIPSNALQGMDAYRGITAKFCHIDWKLQENEPHKVPMFRDLREKSVMCEATLISIDLWDLVQQARAYDVTMTKAINAVEPTGVVFHESRCGSTLMANMLAGFSPGHTRMYSENQVHVQVLKACERNPCNPNLHSKLIKDVFYISGRTVRKERPQYVFYKISSIGSMFVDSFATALPLSRWAYLYRDTVEVMQSHLEKSILSMGKASAVCLRSQNNIYQPPLTVQIANDNGQTPSSLSNEEYCATHLAALSLAAIQEHERTKKGYFANYNQLPGIVWENLLPDHFQVEVTDDMVQRMRDISQNYSKAGRKKGKDGIFTGDGEKKRQAASAAVVAAAEKYAGDVYQKLEILSSQSPPI